ncbi:MAG: amidohydrolase [Flavobacteriaceae bacterium]|jgi:predicted amidohydrolase YtcJ|nr:amidohydrolase [Flavobacteriaceae bacterium]
MRTFIISLIVYTFLIGCAIDKKEVNNADTVYINGKIYTVNEDSPWVEAVAIREGKFIKVGSNAEAESFVGEKTEVIDLAGQFAMPGLGDPHIHPALVMPKRVYCSLPGTFYEPTEEMTLTALKEAIANYPKDLEWFIGAGFSVPAMSPETLTREFLDELIPDRPAFIEDETGGHTAWFNTKAMEAAGISKDTKDTPDTFYSRTKDNSPAGMAYEGGLNAFYAVMPPFDVKLRKTAYMKLLNEATSKGITAAGDAYVFEVDLQPYQELKQEDKINQHLVLYLGGNLGTPELTSVEELNRWWDSYDLPGHKAVKIGMGGSIESYSEALIDGFADAEKSANPFVKIDDFTEYIAQLDAAGFQVKVHAIGDGTVRATLDGYETTIKANGNNRLRHHIDHASLVHSDDFKRFVDLEVACSIWPPLNAPVAYNVQGIKPVLKPETWDRMYDNRVRWDAGMKLFNHSDAPAAVLWPWFGMEATITRGFPGKPEIAKMGPQHALTLKETIKAHTINAAWVLKLDHVTGSIEEGKSADMIVLNHNLFEIEPIEIHKTEVQTTLFKGKVVYSIK